MKTSQRYILLILLFSLFGVNISYSQNNWQRCYKGPSLGYDHQIINFCKSDGNNYLLFIYNHFNNRTEIFKINEYGDSLLSTYILSRGADACVSTGDGGAVFSGAGDDAYSVKINSVGGQIWNALYPGTGGYSSDIIKTSDNYYVMVSGGITKIDNNGNFIWQKPLQNAFSIQQLSVVEALDGGYVVAGNILDSIDAGIVTKTDTSGVILWSHRFYYNNPSNAVIDMRVTKTSNGYIAGGRTWSAGKEIIQLFTIGLNGNIKDTLNFDQFLNDNIEFCDLKTLSDNRIVVLYQRYTSSLGLLSLAFITDTLGNVKAHKEYSGTDLTLLTHINVTPPNTIMFAGSSSHLNIYKEWPYVVKTDTTLEAPPVSVSNISQEIPEKFSLKQNYPNPFNNTTQIEFGINKRGQYSLKIYDVTGKLISELFNQTLEPGEYKTDFNASNFSSGVYYYKLESTTGAITKKLVLLK